MTGIRADRPRFIFVFLAIFGVVLFVTRPEPTRAQVIFRSALIVAGIGGIAWLHLRRGRR